MNHLPRHALMLTLVLAASSATAQAQDASAPVADPTVTTEAAPADQATDAVEATPAADAVEATPAADAVEATPAAAVAPAAEAAVEAAVAAPAVQSEKLATAIGAPAEGKGLVVFFRPGKFAGAAIGFKVREAGVELGKLGNGSFFALQVEPGTHTYVVHSEAKDVTNLEVEAGETYFLAGSISMGFLAGRPNLSPSDATSFETVLPKLKKSLPLN